MQKSSQASSGCKPKVTDAVRIDILTEPQDEFRYRYMSETTKSTHGFIDAYNPNAKTGKGKKGRSKGTGIGPEIKVSNYPPGSKIRVSACSVEGQIHYLCIRVPNEENEAGIYEAPIGKAKIRFDNVLSMLIPTDKNEEPIKKSSNILRARLKLEGKNVTIDESEQLAKELKKKFRARLRYDVISSDGAILATALSNTVIKNMRHLNIAAISHSTADCEGGQEILLFVSKVDSEMKESIGVKFVDPERSFDEFAPADLVHAQCGIRIKAPPFPLKEGEEEAKIKITLFADGAESEPRDFLYKRSADYRYHESKKRKLNEMEELRSISTAKGNSRREAATACPSTSTAVASSQTVPASLQNITAEPQAEQTTTAKYLVEHVDSIDLTDCLDKSDLAQIDLSIFDMDTEYDAVQYVAQGPAEPTKPRIRQPSVTPVVRQLAANSSRSLHRYAESGDVVTLIRPMRQLLGVWDDEFGENALHKAVVSTQFAALQYMLEALKPHGSQLINDYDENMQTPLHLATFTNQPSVIRLLLQNGANPNARNRSGDSALHLAARECGMVAELKELLDPENYNGDFKPNLNFYNYKGQTPLHLAIEAGYDASIVSLMFATSPYCDVDVRSGCDGATPLHLAAARENRVKLMAVLLIQGKADPDLPMFNGDTSLHVAVRNSNLPGIKLLLSVGASRDIRNFESPSDDAEISEEDDSKIPEEDDEEIGFIPADLSSDEGIRTMLLEYKGDEDDVMVSLMSGLKIAESGLKMAEPAMKADKGGYDADNLDSGINLSSCLSTDQDYEDDD